jgi:hypothetical protein
MPDLPDRRFLNELQATFRQQAAASGSPKHNVMALLGGFLKQMNDSIESNRRLLSKKITVEKIKQAYRDQVMKQPSHYEHMNPEELKAQIRLKLARNRIRELTGRAYAIGLMILFMAAVIWLITLVTAFTTVHAQIPQDIPHQSEPVDFTSLPNVLIYIVLPVLMVILYYYWRKKWRKK